MPHILKANIQQSPRTTPGRRPRDYFLEFREQLRRGTGLRTVSHWKFLQEAAVLLHVLDNLEWAAVLVWITFGANMQLDL